VFGCLAILPTVELPDCGAFFVKVAEKFVGRDFRIRNAHRS